MSNIHALRSIAISALAGAILTTAASANPLSLLAPDRQTPDQRVVQPMFEPQRPATEQAARFKRQIVDYATHEAPGTIVIDTPNTHLYYLLGGGKAIRYGIGVGREGFTWSGVETVSRMAEWPDWSPPPEMIGRQPYLPRFMAGGPGNPLGARALYLGNTAYRIHGTNDPSTIGHRVSSGCIRLTNPDIVDLFGRARLGGKVVVLPAGPRNPPAVATQARNALQSTAYR